MSASETPDHGSSEDEASLLSQIRNLPVNSYTELKRLRCRLKVHLANYQDSPDAAALMERVETAVHELIISSPQL